MSVMVMRVTRVLAAPLLVMLVVSQAQGNGELASQDSVGQPITTVLTERGEKFLPEETKALPVFK